jgi:hypothetical protein
VLAVARAQRKATACQRALEERMPLDAAGDERFFERVHQALGLVADIGLELLRLLGLLGGNDVRPSDRLRLCLGASGQ